MHNSSPFSSSISAKPKYQTGFKGKSTFTRGEMKLESMEEEKH